MEQKFEPERREGLGDVLKSLRMIYQMSVKELANKMNVSSAYICEIEANNKKPSLDMLSKYSEVFNTDMSVIMYFDEERKRKKYDHRRLLLEILKKLVDEPEAN